MEVTVVPGTDEAPECLLIDDIIDAEEAPLDLLKADNGNAKRDNMGANMDPMAF
eukprot:gene12553-8974_t